MNLAKLPFKGIFGSIQRKIVIFLRGSIHIELISFHQKIRIVAVVLALTLLLFTLSHEKLEFIFKLLFFPRQNLNPVPVTFQNFFKVFVFRKKETKLSLAFLDFLRVSLIHFHK